MPNYDYFPSQDPSLNLLLPTEMLQRLEGAKKIEHYSPGVLGHIDIAFAQLDDDEQDPRRNLPSRVQDNYNLYKLTLQRALNKQEVSPEFNEIFTDELGSLLIFDKLIALHELFKLFIELDEEPDLSLPFAESAISSLSKRSNCEDYSRGIASVLQEESTYNWNLNDVEHYLINGYFATLLSGKASAYRVFHDAAHSALGKLTKEYSVIDFVNNTLINQPRQLRRQLSELGDNNASSAVNVCTRAELLRQIEIALDPMKVIGKVQLYRQRLLRFASSVNFNPQISAALEYALGAHPSAEQLPLEQPEQLNWALLPPGELENHTRDIVQSKQHEQLNSQPYIDLERLRILENLRQWWGPDYTYYVKGLRTRRRSIKGETEEVPDEYIMLILQVHDQNGTFLYENAIAESPIGGHNALYIQRYDVNGWQWNELMAYPKRDVQAMGARALKHDRSDPYMIHNMTERAKILLTNHPQAFLNGEFHGFDREGKPYLHIPRNVMDIILAEQNDQ